MATKSGRRSTESERIPDWLSVESETGEFVLDEHGQFRGEIEASIEEYDGWMVSAQVLVDAHRATSRVVGLTIRPTVSNHVSPRGEVTSGMLRAIHLHAMLLRAERAQQRLFGPHDELASALNVGRKRGRPRELTDARLAEIAKRYVDLLDAQAPLRSLASELNFSYGRARGLIELARRRGLLSGTVRGRKGGCLTPAGEAALEEAKKHGSR